MKMIRRATAAAFLTVALTLVLAPAASAQTYTGVNPPSVGAVLGDPGGDGQVLSSAGERSPAGQVLASRVNSAAAAGAVQAQVGGLAFTGADVITLALLAGSLILVGVIIVRGARARASDHAS